MTGASTLAAVEPGSRWSVRNTRSAIPAGPPAAATTFAGAASMACYTAFAMTAEPVGMVST